jgi:hypothetical protein
MSTAFAKLPSGELSRLGVDMHHEYVAGTEEAASLRAAWTLRQTELKDMMDKQLKAAEYMGTLAGHLVNSSLSEEEVLFYLDELEQLLADIDNSRDFHTIGGWPNLTSLLPGLTHRSLQVQAKAVHCIGTAIKNDYDFQLWVLESAGGQVEGRERTVLDLLLSAMHDISQQIITTMDLSDAVKTDMDELQRRVLYALSSAVRGNMDVQASLSSSTSGTTGEEEGGKEGLLRPSFENLLKSCVETPALSVGVKRKCWHMVSDLLDEMVYIRHDVMKEFAAMQQQKQEQEVVAGQEDSNNPVMTANILHILKSLQPMGMVFVTPELDWLVLAEEVAAEIASSCTLGGGGVTATSREEEEGRKEESCVLRTSPVVRDIFAHVTKIKAVLRAEYSDDDLSSIGAASSDQQKEQRMRLRQLEERFGAAVDAFRKHPLMEDDTLY